ncbi:hypothetical protein [Kitasatospora sp. NPDC002965]|uniref:hypothetical protein n=1 Tax=Kitasatospora sp. NPDC002965 TaxID=3154775 RepID=UPI0033B86C1F
MTNQTGPSLTASPLSQIRDFVPVNWLSDHLNLLLGIGVAAVAGILAIRMWRRVERELEEQKNLPEAEAERRKELSDVRGRRVEDVLTVLVASAAAGLSSDGLRRLGRHVIHLQPPWDWMPFAALDVAAVVCGMRARRRSRSGKSPGPSGVLVWVLAATSSAFSASEASDTMGMVARAVWPIIAATLFELGSIEERLAMRELSARKAGLWLDRKLSLVRMCHPVEWVRVQLALAANEHISQTEATRQVRIDRAGYRLYRLRQLLGDPKAPARTGRFINARIARADRLAQLAQARVPIEDHESVMTALLRRVRTPEYARLNFRSTRDVETAMQTRLTDQASTAPGGRGPGAGTADAGTGMGTASYPRDRVRTRSALDPYPGTTPAGTGTASGLYPVAADAGTGTGERPYLATTGTGTGSADRPYLGTTETGTGTAKQAVPAANSQVTAGTVVPAPRPGSQPEPLPGTAAGTESAHAGTAAGTDEVPGPVADSVYEYDLGPVRPTAGTGGQADGPAPGTATTLTHQWAGTAGPGTDTDPGTGPWPDDALAGTDSDTRTDGELAPLLLARINPDGKTFSTGGIKKTQAWLGVNQARAQRVMDLARQLHQKAGETAAAEAQQAAGPAESGVDLGQAHTKELAHAPA